MFIMAIDNLSDFYTIEIHIFLKVPFIVQFSQYKGHKKSTPLFNIPIKPKSNQEDLFPPTMTCYKRNLGIKEGSLIKALAQHLVLVKTGKNEKKLPTKCCIKNTESTVRIFYQINSTALSSA